MPSVANINDFMILNDGSPNSRLRVAYYGRGVWETGMLQPAQIPNANFTADAKIICPGSTVHFTNQSTANSTSYVWTFPGGNPSSSTQLNQDVTYSSAGVYPVTLVS